MKDHILPFPEIVNDKTLGWLVRDALIPNVNAKKKIIDTPLAENPEALAIRTQTLGALKWSPRSYPSTPSLDLVQAVEACRINILLTKAGLDISLGGMSSPIFQVVARVIADSDVETGVVIRFSVVSLLHLHLTAKAALLDEVLKPLNVNDNIRLRPLVQTAIEMLKKDLSFSNTAAVAKYLESILGKPSIHHTDLLQTTFDRSGYGETYGHNLTTIPWGRLIVEESPRAESMPRRRLARTWRAIEQGVVFRYPNRYLSDKAVFACPRRTPAGSLLVDVSGSMGKEYKDLATLIDTIPPIIIATYSGHDGVGVLRIVAKSGQRLTKQEIEARPGGGGNIVDGPALKWLSAQPHPRIWVSDGGVTGVDDVPGSGNKAECDNICQSAHITRIRSTKEALQAFVKHATKMKRRPLRKGAA